MDDVRIEVKDWVAENWSTDLTVREWWRRLADAGLAMPAWPEPYGRGMSTRQARAVTEELAVAGVIAAPQGTVGVTLAGPTLLAHGTAEQQDRYLPPLLRGEESWCQLFSEPGAGSDLPALSTRAIQAGNGWVVDGQKVWNSGADIARRGMLLARTDVDRPKHEGITFFVLDMDQDGVEARPLRQMNGEAHFCEVFITEARVDDADIVGDRNDGWRVARTTMGFERAMVASRAPKGLVHLPSGERSGILDRVVGDVLARDRKRPSFTGNAVPARRLVQLAQERGVTGNAHIRQQLAHYFALTEINRYTQLRAAASLKAGNTPGPEGSITKLAVSNLCQVSRELTFSILGPAGMLSGDNAPYDGSLHTVALASCGTRIGGGTDEIQRNTIGERALGLPREPAEDRDVPFRDLRR
jgi:alkylation response protein AidB-like acyl-CoA dehydrogenase